MTLSLFSYAAFAQNVLCKFDSDLSRISIDIDSKEIISQRWSIAKEDYEQRAVFKFSTIQNKKGIVTLLDGSDNEILKLTKTEKDTTFKLKLVTYRREFTSSCSDLSVLVSR